MELLSPFSGKVFKVLIKNGAQVKEDDEAFVIEAMKMENPIYVPANGTVKEIKVKEGDTVDADAVLAIIE